MSQRGWGPGEVVTTSFSQEGSMNLRGVSAAGLGILPLTPHTHLAFILIKNDF